MKTTSTRTHTLKRRPRAAWLASWGLRALKRFVSKVEVDPSGCWLWTSAGVAEGQPMFEWQGATRSARRMAWDIYVGELAAEDSIEGTCGNPACVNPRHAAVASVRRPFTRLIASQVIEIRYLAERGISHQALADQFEVGPLAISRLLARETWSDLPQPAHVRSALLNRLPDQCSGLTAIERRKLARRVQRAAESLTEREQAIVTRYFGLDDRLPESLTSIAARQAVSREVVRKIKTRVLRKLGLGVTLPQLRAALAPRPRGVGRRGRGAGASARRGAASGAPRAPGRPAVK